jgi:hypothetical protein
MTWFGIRRYLWEVKFEALNISGHAISKLQELIPRPLNSLPNRTYEIIFEHTDVDT